MKVREIMTKAVRCAAPETTLDMVARMMREEDVGAVPVLDGDELCGIITDRDIVLRCVAEQDDPTEVTAEDIISGQVRTIEPDADIEEASRIMAEEQIRRLPVCKGNRLIGMLSIGDIAVKAPDVRIAGEMLENVSEGVKATKPGQRSGMPQGANADVSGPESAGIVAGGRQEIIEQQPGRHASGASNTRGRQSKVVSIRADQQTENEKKTREETKKSVQRRAAPGSEPEPPRARREQSVQRGKSAGASHDNRSDRKRRAS